MFLPKLKKCPQGVNELYCVHKNGADLWGKVQNEDIKPAAMAIPGAEAFKEKENISTLYETIAPVKSFTCSFSHI